MFTCNGLEYFSVQALVCKFFQLGYQYESRIPVQALKVDLTLSLLCHVIWTIGAVKSYVTTGIIS